MKHRRSSRFIEFDGISMTLSQWARHSGISAATLHARLKSGWTLERALSEPAGTAKRLGRRAIPIEVRFEEQFVPEPNSGCWIWAGSVCGRGYGTIKDKFRAMRRASRVSWELHVGEIPNGMCVLHKCDTPVCVNPDHLFVGTNKDNSDDMCRKGRMRNQWTGKL